MENRNVFSVSQINEYIKSLLDSSQFLSRVYVKGEISNFKNHYQSGHYYFTLKDGNSLIKAVMFQSYASRLPFMPEENMSVIVCGRISVFPRDGVYQIYAENMEPLGKGSLYAAFEQMKGKLAAKGFFDGENKKEIPRFPHKIGIITSPTGAAVEDMKNIISRRYPPAEIEIYPALVQGPGAAEDLCKGILHFENDETCDVIIIGRGGGSIEDLWAFNDENLANVIFYCKTPVISAVGHETDFTICDFVSDLRAPTPSAAAELAVPDKAELKSLLKSFSSRINSGVNSVFSSKKAVLDNLREKKCFSSPGYLLDRYSELLASYDRRISISFEHKNESAKASLAAVSARLAALNPMNVLSRGYSAVFDKAGKVVSSVNDVKEKDKISIVVSDGKINAIVSG